MKQRLLLGTALLGFTFSYSILNALLPGFSLQRTAIKMTVWTAAILLSYAAYTFLAIHKPIAPTLRQRLNFLWAIPFPILASILIGLATLFPSPGHDHFDMLYIVVIAVMGEEVLFRGLLWDLVNDWAGHCTVFRLPGTLWLTAFAFGTMHLQYHDFKIHLASLFQVSYSFILGIILGAVRLRTKSLLPAICTHSAFNSLFNLLIIAY